MDDIIEISISNGTLIYNQSESFACRIKAAKRSERLPSVPASCNKRARNIAT